MPTPRRPSTTVLLVKSHVIAKPVRKLAVAIRNTTAQYSRPLDKTEISAIINIERRCDKRLALELGYFKVKKPSLARVAVSAFYDDRHREGSDM